MLETLKGLLEAAKATTYEVLALLLPGAVVLGAFKYTYEFAIPFVTIGAIAGAYIAGMVLQAIADTVLKRERVSAWICGDKLPWQSSADYALELIQKRLEAAPAEAMLDICLTHVGTRRTVYDKFIGLRDTARGLAFATVVTAGVLVVGDWDTIVDGTTGCVIARFAGALTLTAGLFLAFIQRYARFRPLALQALYGQFIATQFETKD